MTLEQSGFSAAISYTVIHDNADEDGSTNLGTTSSTSMTVSDLTLSSSYVFTIYATNIHGDGPSKASDSLLIAGVPGKVGIPLTS